MSIAEACADVAVLAAEISERCEPDLQPDAAAAGLIAAASARAAASFVEANLAITEGDERLERAQAAVRAATAAN